MVADFGISSYRPGRFPTCSDEGRIFLKGLFQYSQNSYIYVHICILYSVAFIEDDFKIAAITGPDTFGGRGLAALRVSRLLNHLSVCEQVQVVASFIRQILL